MARQYILKYLRIVKTAQSLEKIILHEEFRHIVRLYRSTQTRQLITGIATPTTQPNYVKRVSKEGPKYNEPLPKSLKTKIEVKELI